MTAEQVPQLVFHTSESAHALSMGEDELRNLLRAGEIEHYRTAGGHFRVPRWALEEYTRRRCAETRAEAAEPG